MSQQKDEFLERSKTFWNPNKTQFWQDAGVDLVIDRREDYHLYDMDGKRLIDVHLNGGTYNLGHRNAELLEVLNAGGRRFDMGNHHFPALARTALAEKLAECTPEGLQYTIYGAGGAEAIELAIKSARNATQKRKIVSIVKAYHGHSGLSVKAGDERFSKTFLSEDLLDEFVQVPFNDLSAMEDALKGRDVAAVIMETIPATYGFPMPHEGYLPEVKRLCERYDSLYIADEVQTGLMRTGSLWGITKYGVTPDIMVIGKGITGGMYPISCCVVNERAGQWLKQDGFAHMSTAGGAELGCIVAMKVLEITQRPEVASMVTYISDYVRAGLDEIRALYPDFFIGIRQNGVIMGLEFNDPEGAKPVMRHLYEHGVWAIFSTLDPSVLQFKPGILMTQEMCEEMLRRVEVAVGLAQREVFGETRRRVA
ncbi:MAG: aspartate aminotransferase family protein [Rhodospirillales bacterium]|jgi:acetylornithine/succinyldiaminopimelate/putrescine aminotransferase|nr:aspartate aminotransferase family protein [Rhodospirillales bacterium]MBT4038559.1 aspartate aminotransferase family protein [Rhodospirillales bacterium]MBT4627414.1 aspartate aminotransferase family protein [Rhodospirillales bacterium]MBT5351467.1 aspartate aminotransferase family protein [Rhodospirillales bacterium]MBT5519130.1 aspartate aminotransferase family protein [Rhodospirillales bacterium]